MLFIRSKDAGRFAFVNGIVDDALGGVNGACGFMNALAELRAAILWK